MASRGRAAAAPRIVSPIICVFIRGGQRLKILIEINRTIKIFNAAINF